MNKPSDPGKQMGVYTDLEDIPDIYRLHHYAEQFSGEDTWNEFVETKNLKTRAERQRFNRVGDSWKGHIQDSKIPHHALADPETVESWIAELLEDRTVATVYHYWCRLESFYRYMMESCNYPHLYHPVMIAVIEGTESQKIWQFKLDQR